MKFGNHSARFKNFGMKISCSFRQCDVRTKGKQCDKFVFLRNKCELEKRHCREKAHHCQFHEKRLGCGLCLMEREEGYCEDCPEDLCVCHGCNAWFCMDCEGGNECEVCEGFFCTHCGCPCDESEEAVEEDNVAEEDEDSEPSDEEDD